MKANILFLVLISSAIFFQSCNDDDDDTPTRQIVQSYDISLQTTFEIPTVSDRDETGTIKMDLYDDNSLEFTITVNNLSGSDALTAAHVHSGDVVSTGDAKIPLVTDATGISFSGNSASGTINLSADQIAILNGSDVYVNVHSSEHAPGLLRGQIDETIDTAYNVALAAANAIPANERSEVGNAIFRIIGSKVYYKITIDNLDATDAIAAGHIHSGAIGATGGVLINLEMTDSAQLGITKSVELDSDQLNSVNNDEVYVNIHSSQESSGLVRGQIR